MNARQWNLLERVVAILAGVLACSSIGIATAHGAGPNILFILADDLGYGDLGCYGQKQIRTPNIDKLAAEGMRFTQCYAGSTVCAPSRCCLMTGLHTGHGRVRGNALVPLQPEDKTVAEVLKGTGYTTALIGKWGLGEPNSSGVPNKKGFDSFFGYLNQVHAHNYYPDYLWRDQQKEPLEGNVVEKGVAVKRAKYSHDLFTEEALAFVDKNKSKPFFLYLAYTIPHANNEAGKNGMEVPDDAPYGDKDWPQAQKNHAAMITRLDRDVGRLLKQLKDLGLDDKTLVLFSSDNGPHKEGGADPKFFASAGPLRGFKRDLTEGGIRVPLIARWPGQVQAGSSSDLVCAFWDFLSTAADLAGAPVPEKLDGLSIVPTLLGEKRADRPQKTHEFLYWEFHERGFEQAVRMGDWKYIRRPYAKDRPAELYNLKDDLGETKNVAGQHEDVVARMEAYLKEARTESKDWPVPPKKKN
jgi:arylsulfatase A-like enzyme